MKGPTQERSHACSNCDKTFKESEYLKKHERTHTRDKPFACSKCKKAFNYNEVLKGHEVTHKGEKLFAYTKFAKKFKEYCTLMGKQMIYHLCGSLGAVLEELNNFMPLQILPP